MSGIRERARLAADRAGKAQRLTVHPSWRDSLGTATGGMCFGENTAAFYAAAYDDVPALAAFVLRVTGPEFRDRVSLELHRRLPSTVSSETCRAIAAEFIALLTEGTP